MEDKFYAYALLFITLKYVTGVREFVETLRNPLRPVITGVFGIFPFAEFIKPPSIFKLSFTPSACGGESIRSLSLGKGVG